MEKPLIYQSSPIFQYSKFPFEYKKEKILNSNEEHSVIVQVKQRSGTVNLGRTFEHLAASYFGIKCLLDENIKDFWMLSNADGFESFDDIVLHVEYRDSTSHLFVVQCKQRENRKYILPNQFLNPSHKTLNLRNYEKSYVKLKQRIKNQEIKSVTGHKLLPDVKEDQVSYILYMTMRFNFNESSSQDSFVEAKQISLENTDKVSLLNTKKQGKIFKLNVLNANFRKDFLKQFYVFTEQLTVQNGPQFFENLLHHLGEIEIGQFYGAIQNYFREFMMQNRLLTKTKLQRDVFALFTQNYTTSTTQNTKSLNDTWTQILQEFDLVILPKVAMNEVLKFNFHYKAHILCCDCENNLKFVGNLCKVLSQKCVIFTSSKIQPTVEGCKIFSSVENLPKNLTYNLEKINMSLQRKSTILLRNLTTFHSINRELHFMKAYDFLRFTSGGFLEIGSALGKNFHVPRRFRKIHLSPEIFQQNYNGNVFVVLYEKPECYSEVMQFFKPSYVDIEGFCLRMDSDNPSQYESMLHESLKQETFIIPLIEDYCKNIIEKIVVNFNNTQASFHVIRYANKLFELYYSTSGINTLRPFVLKCTKNYTLEEQDLISYYKSRVNILTCNAGAGKTNQLKHLSTIYPPNYWTVFLDLAKMSNIFQTTSEKNFKQFLIDFLDVPDDFKEFCFDLFTFMLEKNQVIFLLDGYDEAHGAKAKKIVEEIVGLKNKVWIATRPSFTKELEDKYNTFSIEIEDLDEEFVNQFVDQKVTKNYNLKKILNSHLEVLNNPTLLNRAVDLINENKLNKNSFKSVDLYESLYSSFYDKNDFVIMAIMALKVFFSQETINELIINTDITESLQDKFISEFHSKKQYHYIITGFDQGGNIPKFTHNVFAAYLVAKYLASNSKVELFQQFIKRNLFKSETVSIRKIFDAIIAKKLRLHEAILNVDLESVVQNLKLLGEKDCLNRTALHIAASYEISDLSNNNNPNSKFFELLLIQANCGELVHEKDLLGFDVFDYAASSDCLINLDTYYKKFRAKSLFLTVNEIPKILICATNQLNNVLYNSKFDFLLGSIIYKYKRKTLLNIIVENCNFKTIKKIVRNECELFGGCDFINELYLLHSACLNFNNNDDELFNIVNFLQQEGCDVNKKITESTWFVEAGLSPLHTALKYRNFKAVSALLDLPNLDTESLDSTSQTALHVASSWGNVESTKKLLQREANVFARNTRGVTSLHLVCLYGHIECVINLLNVNVQLINVPDDSGSFPLHYAVLKRHENNTNCITILLNNGADINAVNASERTVLHWACRKGFPECVEILLKYGADVNAKDVAHLTPLHYACLTGSLECVKLLIYKNANLFGRDRMSRRPLECAEESNNLNCVSLIKETMAKAVA